MRPLRLPIEPYGPVGAVKDVVMDIHVQRSVELDTGNFRAMVDHLVMDMMDTVSVDLAEDRAEMADDAALLAFRNLVVANDMAADMLLIPMSLMKRAENDLLLALSPKLEFQIRPLILAGGDLLAEADAAAGRFADLRRRRWPCPDGSAVRLPLPCSTVAGCCSRR